jgi:D-proline reductase (dithiol) PrdB
MPLRYIELMDYYSRSLPPTPWVESQGVPWTPLRKPLAECTLMMLASAGVRRKSEPPFQPANDLTFRLIDSAADAASLAPSHPAPIRRPGEADVNVVFPVERLRELQAEGLFRALTPHHVSILGPIRKFRELHYEMAPAIAEQARAEGADLLLLVPL